MRFANLSENSQNVLGIAAAESKMLDHFYIGTEHLFNGFCKVDDDLIKKVFEKFDIDPLIRKEIRAKIGMGNGSPWGSEMIFTPRINHTFKMAAEIAKIYKMHFIEPIHLLLALLRGGDGVAVRTFKEKVMI